MAAEPLPDCRRQKGACLVSAPTWSKVSVRLACSSRAVAAAQRHVKLWRLFAGGPCLPVVKDGAVVVGLPVAATATASAAIYSPSRLLEREVCRRKERQRLRCRR